MTPESLREKSPESIKKILSILENLKEEWDLTPKNDAMQSLGGLTHFKPAYETSIPHPRYWKWIDKSGLEGLYQLENILAILEQEGLLLDTQFVSEYM